MSTQEEKNLDHDSPAVGLANALNIKMDEILWIMYDAAKDLSQARKSAEGESVEREDQIFGNLFVWYVDADIAMNERMIDLGLIRLDIDEYINKMSKAATAISKMSNLAMGAKVMVRLQQLELRVKNLQRMASG